MKKAAMAFVLCTSGVSMLGAVPTAHAFFGLDDPLGGAATGALIGGIAGGGKGAAIGAAAGAVVGEVRESDRRWEQEQYERRRYEERRRY